jgi:hypothetical protein
LQHIANVIQRDTDITGLISSNHHPHPNLDLASALHNRTVRFVYHTDGVFATKYLRGMFDAIATEKFQGLEFGDQFLASARRTYNIASLSYHNTTECLDEAIYKVDQSVVYGMEDAEVLTGFEDNQLKPTVITPTKFKWLSYNVNNINKSIDVKLVE